MVIIIVAVQWLEFSLLSYGINMHFMHPNVTLTKMLHWATSWTFLFMLQMLEDCCSSALWGLPCPFSSSAFVYVCPFFPLCSVCWLFVLPDTQQSPKLLLLPLITVLLWSKADFAAAQQAFLQVLATMPADLSVHVKLVIFFFFNIWR